MRSSWTTSSTRASSCLAARSKGDRETMHIIEAPSEEAIRERFATDPWWVNGMLRPVRIERWEIVLDGRN